MSQSIATTEELRQKHCVPCEGGVPKLEGQEILNHLSSLAEWDHLPDPDRIHKTFTKKNFREGLAMVNKIGELAEAEKHHPDIRLSYSKVSVEIYTHAINGLSENDFILAAKIDEIA